MLIETNDPIIMLLDSGILDLPCHGCDNKAMRRKDCQECDKTGYRFHQFRLNCAKEHWAGNLPADCHPDGFVLPGRLEMAGLLLSLPSFRYCQRLAGGTYLASFRKDKKYPSDNTVYSLVDSHDFVATVIRAFMASIHGFFDPEGAKPRAVYQPMPEASESNG